ncbi:MAG: serine protease [Acidobacteria bacterium]|nr:serine protease [Acidobacteriota bacterium]
MTKPAYDFDRLQAALLEAAGKFDSPEVDALCRTIAGISDPAPDSFVKTVFGALRKQLYFSQMQRLAEFYLRSGKNGSPQVRRQYVQALVDQGLCWPALSFLETTLANHVVGPEEYKELAGLKGRAWKQLFVEAQTADPDTRRDYLDHALAAYGTIYRADPANSLWHGINVVALLARAQREKIPVKEYAAGDLRRISQLIVAAVEAKPAPDAWDLATAMEANLALGRKRQALAAARGYAASEGADAFELRSTLRQLEEVWQLIDDAEPGKSLLSVLRGHLAGLKGGVVNLSPSEIVSANKDAAGMLEAFGEGNPSYAFYKAGLDRARSVARIDTPAGFGTGFLVNMKDFGEKFGDQVVLMTCGHVLREEDRAKAKVRFEAAKLDAVVTRNVLWRDRYQGDLGLWIVTPVNRKAKLPSPCPLGSLTERVAVGSRVVLIGHPDGRELTYSMANNEVITADGHELTYRAPTREGSSGSPVFDGEWRVVGMHQRGGVAAYPAQQMEPSAASSAASAADAANGGTTVSGAKEIISEMGSDQGGHKVDPRQAKPKKISAAAGR